jgi:predicted molibdopterin-dependent oxidoreductase YjgC
MTEVHLSLFPGTDVALINGMMRAIVKKGNYNKKFIKDRCEDFDPFLESLDPYTLEAVEDITGVPGDKIMQAAMLFAEAKSAIVLYGMGITQHTTGTDNVKAIANLLMLTGNLGREGTGFSPLRGQNNVQGACDMGALPNVYPGYQRVDNPEARAKFQEAWARDLDPKPGLTVVDMFQEASKGKLKALYVVGENPMLSEADLQHAREAIAKLDFLAVQDIFPTETALLADVVLPAASFAEKEGTFTNTERRVQLIREVIDPPGEARVDWKIISDIAQRLKYPMTYKSSAEIMEEISRLTPIYGGISQDRLTRILEHWHTGSMSHRSRVLEALAPESRVEISPVDAAKLGIEEGDIVSLSSRRGKVQTRVKSSKRIKPGQAFMPFHWRDAPANLLTNPVVDPLAKIPEYKVSSVKAILEVLERAIEDNAFLLMLATNPAGALKCYDLSPVHRAALVAGDIETIEKWVGPLDKRLQDWMKARLDKENLSDAERG